MPFELLTPQAATLTSVTPRTETHGEDKVFAISLGIKIAGANTLLDLLSPTLRHMLYKAVEGQDVLPGVEPSTPLLRSRGVEMLTLAGALDGWTLAVDHGIDEADPITLGGCKVDRFRVSPMEGGSIELLFRVGSNDIDATEAGLLCSHLSQEISITLTAPKRQEPVIDGTVAAFEADHPPSAEDLFSAAEQPAEPERGQNWPFGTEGGPDDQDDDEGSQPDADAPAELEDQLETALAAKPRRGRKVA